MFNAQQLLSDHWQQLNEVATKYHSQDGLQSYHSQINSFVMKVPFVGLFSAGKSSLLNKILGENLLSVQITPETAIATELHYTAGEEAFYGHKADQEQVSLTRTDIENQNFKSFFDAGSETDYGWVSTHINAPVLQKFPHICLVDLPGLESDFTSHTRMIDQYIQQSLAYCIVVSIEDGELKASTQQFLQELKINNTPIILIITKSDIKNDDDTQAIAERIEASITALLKSPPLRTVVVSARRSKNIDAVIDAIGTIEDKAEQQFNKVVTLPIVSKLTFLIQSLDRLIEMDDVNIEQLQADKQMHRQEIDSFRKKLTHDTQQLETKTRAIIDNIIDRTESSLITQLDMLANNLVQGQEISTAIENIVRLAVSEGVQNELVPAVDKYIKHVEAELPENLKIGSVELNFNNIDDSEFSFTDITKALSPVLLLLKFHPIVAVISTIVVPTLAVVLDMLMSSSKKAKQIEQQTESAKQALLLNIIPKIKLKVRLEMTKAVIDNIAQAKQMMETIVNEREQQIQAQIAQTEQDIKAGEAEQQQRKALYSTDKHYIKSIIDDLTQAI